MAVFYRGAGVGTHWHVNNPKLTGFIPWNPSGVPADRDRIMLHVAKGITQSPYISLTRSFAIAWGYAIFGSKGTATATNPGYVYEIELDANSTGTRSGLELIDPVNELAATLSQPLVTPSYQHDGDQNLLLGIVRPARFRSYLTKPPLQPGGAGAYPPRVPEELKTLIHALRDAEILAIGNIPSSAVRNVYPAY